MTSRLPKDLTLRTIKACSVSVPSERTNFLRMVDNKALTLISFIYGTAESLKNVDKRHDISLLSSAKCKLYFLQRNASRGARIFCAMRPANVVSFF